MAANEQNMKMEVGEVKVEKTELDTESLGIEHNSWGLVFEGDHDERTNRIIGLQRIKDEHNFVEAGSNIEVLEMQSIKTKVEENWEDCKQFEPTYTTDEGIIEHDNNDNFTDEDKKIALDSGPQQEVHKKHLIVPRESSDALYSCSNCNFTTSYRYHLTKHMKEHRRQSSSEMHSFKVVCIHCNATFAYKKNLDEHTVRKHPDFIASVSCKVHVCPCCTYKTTEKVIFDRHMMKHSDTVDSYNPSICAHCNATYKSKQKLDNHIISKHPDSIASISSKIHECEYCTYKTTVKSNLIQHMIQHTETADIYKLRCLHCDETFKRRPGLDEHIIKKHPHLISTLTCKIHECTYCAYQTVLKHHFVRHMLKHPETVDNYKLKVCVHCNAEFKNKVSLDNHTIRKHPDFVASVSRKLHECAHCTFITVTKANLDRHMLKHSKSAGSYNVSICVHCNATYKSKQILDYHIIRKHPDSIASISSKIHECTYCAYKTTLKSNFSKHMQKHSETVK